MPGPGAGPRTVIGALRQALRLRHYSRRTEKAYVQWVRRFIRFHEGRHPRELAEREVTAFLTALAVRRRVSASTQNQALHALLFLYREVLVRRFAWLDGPVRAKRTTSLPGLLPRDEVRPTDPGHHESIAEVHITAVGRPIDKTSDMVENVDCRSRGQHSGLDRGTPSCHVLRSVLRPYLFERNDLRTPVEEIVEGYN